MTRSRARAGRGGRTLVVTHPSSELYGSDRVLVESVAGFVELGWSVEVVLPEGGPLVGLLLDEGAHVTIRPFPVLRKEFLSPRGLVRLAWASLRGLPWQVRMLRRSEVGRVYVNTVTTPTWLVAARLARVPSVCHVHEAEASAPRILRIALASPLLLAGRVVANSTFSRGVLEAAVPWLAGRTQVVYNAVAGPTEPAPPRTELEGPVRLAFVGRLSPRKGPDVAIAALALLRSRGVDSSLTLLGDVYAGYEWFARDLHDLVRREGLEAHVRFEGFVPDVWPHLERHDVVLVPSVVDEPFGNTAVEAVLAQRPSVVSSTSGLREAARGYGSAVQVSPGDASAIADAVAQICAHWPEFERAARRDRVEATARHGAATYRRALGDAAGPAAGAGRDGALEPSSR